VVASLKVKLLPGGPVGGGRRIASLESHDRYLMGIQLLRQGTLEGARRSRAALEEALALDAGNAPAQAALASAIEGVYERGGARTAAEVEDIQRQALAAAEKAVAMAPDLADGYRERASFRRLLFFDWAGWLERSYAERDVAVLWLKVDPLLKKVRADPRYAALLQKMNLPVD
jgi:hypothetical protein